MGVREREKERDGERGSGGGREGEIGEGVQTNEWLNPVAIKYNEFYGEE